MIDYAAYNDDIRSETNKIDNSTTLGLAGTSNSLSYRVHEIETHLHSYERWFGAAAIPSGETHVADHISDNVNAAAFQIDAGNLIFGSWLQILGSSDVPVIAGNVKYDFHEILIAGSERATLYWIQFSFGETAAAGVSAGNYSILPYYPASVQARAIAIEVQGKRHDVGTKAWARCVCPGQDTATLDFYYGLHGYPG